MFQTITTLNHRRIEAGISGETPMSLPITNISHIRGKFARNCVTKHPETLRSAAFRKHVATASQLLSLEDNERNMLTRLSEDTLQLAKLSKLFLLMEQGSVKKFSGQTLDKVVFGVETD